jgi:hypothetical protein
VVVVSEIGLFFCRESVRQPQKSDGFSKPYLVFLRVICPTAQLVQGFKNVIYEGEIPHDPGIVECGRDSKFVPVEETEFVLEDD